MPVHNHGPAEGRGLDCPERTTPNGLRGACMSADALGPSTAGMWHDPNGIIYPYDAEDQAIIDAAQKRHAEQVKADCMNIHDE